MYLRYPSFTLKHNKEKKTNNEKSFSCLTTLRALSHPPVRISRRKELVKKRLNHLLRNWSCVIHKFHLKPNNSTHDNYSNSKVIKPKGREREIIQRGGRRIQSGSGERRNLKFRTSKGESFRCSYSPSPAALPSSPFSPSPAFSISPNSFS